MSSGNAPNPGYAAFFGSPEQSPNRAYSPGGPAAAAQALGQPPSNQGGLGSPGGNPMSQGMSSLNSHAANVRDGILYTYHSVYPPTVPEAHDGRLKYVPRFRYLVFGGTGSTAGQVLTQNIFFGAPTVVIGRTAAAYTVDDSPLPVGRNPLDTFKAQMYAVGTFQDLLDAGAGGGGGGGAVTTQPTARAVGSTLYGPAGLPALIPGHGKLYDPGYFLGCTVELLVPEIEVTICIICIEEIGPVRVS